MSLWESLICRLAVYLDLKGCYQLASESYLKQLSCPELIPFKRLFLLLGLSEPFTVKKGLTGLGWGGRG